MNERGGSSLLVNFPIFNLQSLGVSSSQLARNKPPTVRGIHRKSTTALDLLLVCLFVCLTVKTTRLWEIHQNDAKQTKDQCVLRSIAGQGDSRFFLLSATREGRAEASVVHARRTDGIMQRSQADCQDDPVGWWKTRSDRPFETLCSRIGKVPREERTREVQKDVDQICSDTTRNEPRAGTRE
mmetsp:Transcript_15599/g.27093  ORF Transcript_15599/g.27093 Transcript_15599/m.27093 type:complete len:183 (+) Transcript_15599:181-729(+)